jgi:hypothetical protein
MKQPDPVAEIIKQLQLLNAQQLRKVKKEVDRLTLKQSLPMPDKKK